MATQSPYMKKSQGPFSIDDSAPDAAQPALTPPAKPSEAVQASVSGMAQPLTIKWDNRRPNSPAAGSAMARADADGVAHPSFFGFSPSGPRELQGDGSPVPPPGPPDTRPSAVKVGSALRTAGQGVAAAATAAGHGIANGAVALNNGINAGTDYAQNAIMRPLRASDAWLSNAGKAAMGQDANAVAGPDTHTPMMEKPYPSAALDGSAGGGPVTAMPSFANVEGSVLPTTPTGPVAPGNPAGGANRDTVPDNGAPQSGGVDVTGFDDTTTPRHLGVGAMVNGVPTFSDGSGAGAIPRTMTDEQIKGYGDNVSRADAGALSNVLASDVTGGPVSSAQQVATLVRNANVPITGSRPTAEQFADADRNAIALRDPRSAAGTAAHNLAMEAQYGRGAARKVAAAQLQQFDAGSNQAGLMDQQGENQQAIVGAQGQNALDAIQLRNAGELQNTALSAKLKAPERGIQVQLADGTIGIQDPATGRITRSRFADGTVAKGASGKVDAETARGNAMTDGLGKYTNQLLAEYQKTQALLPPDQRKPAPIKAFRAQAAEAAGIEVRTDPNTGKKWMNVNGKVVPL